MQVNMFPQQQNFCARKVLNFDVSTPMGKYAQEILALPRVHQQDELEVVKAFRSKSPEAKQALINTALRFVLYKVSNLVGLDHPLAMDLFQEGAASMLKTIANAAENETGTEKLLVSLSGRAKQIVDDALPKDIKIRFTWATRGEDDILPVEIKASKRALQKIRKTPLGEPLSFSMPIGKGQTLADVVTDDVTGNPLLVLEKSELKRDLTRAVNGLNSRHVKTIERRFGSEVTYREVGKEFNVTHERVRQLEAIALRKLRRPSISKKLTEYVEG